MDDYIERTIYDVLRSYASRVDAYAKQANNINDYEETLLEGVPEDCRELVDELQKMGRVMYEKKEALIQNEKQALDDEEKLRELLKRIEEVLPPGLTLDVILKVDPEAFYQYTLVSEYLEKLKKNGEVEM